MSHIRTPLLEGASTSEGTHDIVVSSHLPGHAEAFECKLSEVTERRENDSMLTVYRNESLNFKEAEILGFIIGRVTKHADRMSAAQYSHEILARLGDLVEELSSIKGLSFDLLHILTEAVESLDWGPELAASGRKAALSKAHDRRKLEGLPSKQQIILFFADLQEAVRPVADDDSDASESDAKPDVNAKEGQSASEQDAGDGSEDHSFEFSEFADEWWEVYGSGSAKRGKNARAKKARVDERMDEAQETMEERIGQESEIFTKWKDYPVLTWILLAMSESTEERAFGYMCCDYALDKEEDKDDIPELLAWSSLGALATDLCQMRYMDPKHFQVDVPTFKALRTLHAQLLPLFMLQFTQLRTLMLRQAEDAKQMRTKILAACVTAGVAAGQAFAALIVRDYDAGSLPFEHANNTSAAVLTAARWL